MFFLFFDSINILYPLTILTVEKWPLMMESEQQTLTMVLPIQQHKKKEKQSCPLLPSTPRANKFPHLTLVIYQANFFNFLKTVWKEAVVAPPLYCLLMCGRSLQQFPSLWTFDGNHLLLSLYGWAVREKKLVVQSYVTILFNVTKVITKNN